MSEFNVVQSVDVLVVGGASGGVAAAIAAAQTGKSVLIVSVVRTWARTSAPASICGPNRSPTTGWRVLLCRKMARSARSISSVCSKMPVWRPVSNSSSSASDRCAP